MVFDANKFFSEHHSEPEEVSWLKRSHNDFSIGELLNTHIAALIVKAGVDNAFDEGRYSVAWKIRLEEEMNRISTENPIANVQCFKDKIAEINSYDSLLNNDIDPIDQQAEPESVKNKTGGDGKSEKTKKLNKSAWDIGRAWMLSEEKQTGKRPGVIAIAKHVEKEFKRLDIRGVRGDYLDWQTIKKEALTGITDKPANGKSKNN